MLAAGSLKISFITMSQFSTSLYELDIPEFLLFSKTAEVRPFCVAEKCMFMRKSVGILVIAFVVFGEAKG